MYLRKIPSFSTPLLSHSCQSSTHASQFPNANGLDLALSWLHGPISSATADHFKLGLGLLPSLSLNFEISKGPKAVFIKIALFIIQPRLLLTCGAHWLLIKIIKNSLVFVFSFVFSLFIVGWPKISNNEVLIYQKELHVSQLNLIIIHKSSCLNCKNHDFCAFTSL